MLICTNRIIIIIIIIIIDVVAELAYLGWNVLRSSLQLSLCAHCTLTLLSTINERSGWLTTARRMM